MSDNRKQVVLITGSTRGIGLAMAKLFAENGYLVILNGRHENPEALAGIQALSPESFFLQGDVSREEEAEKLFDSIRERKLNLDVLICNSGISRDSLVLRLSGQELDAVLDTNLKSAFYCDRQAARLMLRRREGSILFTSSVVGLTGHEGQAAYAASKAGLIGLAKSLARELAARNIRVNALAPGWIDTEMTRGISREKMPFVPMQRPGRPEEVAEAALFLAGSKSSYITGQVLQIDGGMVM